MIRKLFFGFSSKISFYQILELHPNCSQKDIKSSFSRLAKIYHPDIYKGSDKERFANIQEAYSILKSPEKRKEYDKSQEIVIEEEPSSDNNDYSLNAKYSDLSSMYKGNINDPKIIQEMEKFFSKPIQTKVQKVETSVHSFYEQLSTYERERLNFITLKNSPEYENLIAIHQVPYEKILESSVEAMKEQQLDNKYGYKDTIRKNMIASNLVIKKWVFRIIIAIALPCLLIYYTHIRIDREKFLIALEKKFKKEMRKKELDDKKRMVFDDSDLLDQVEDGKV